MQQTFNSGNILALEWQVIAGRPTEIERREIAQQTKDQVVVGSGSQGKPRKMAQMVSVRLESELVRKAHDIAKHNDITVSEVLREGLRRL